MARTVKEQDYAAKRNEILDAAQRLIATKGYEQMTIQDLLDALRMSKGALYHYFDSKQAVLEGLIDLLLERVEQRFLPVLQDSTLSALDKLQHFFTTLVEWKTEQRPMTLTLLRVWYLDENAIFRQKLREMRVKRFAPRLAVILHQGLQEGSMTLSYPDQTGRVILSLVEDLSDTLARWLLSKEATQDDSLLIEEVVAASTEAVERVLGVPSHSLSLVDAQALSVWMIPSENNPSTGSDKGDPR
ncbi:TetR/AcrR family transcriptional regulator [Ktedonosporobacter rubrisoli]|uniref:TetR/AcrR family transcriptional regulator n=1 Tax=Ktedonosporobacter rubrisoli TaxID=2509675 RepID=A0A4P6JQ01_KTERU|nr:TetR/AcrR family transcriptional regulator [Ktedonosporobacter rubrisoli]QBD77354.1 TetR/AcrR family transcriptional regulator [Ktedonosporobacter rubrisoli]